MKTKTLNRCIILLAISRLAPCARAEEGFAAKALPKSAQATAFTVASSVKNISILKDGILSEAPVGKNLAAKSGMNELLFSAPGYGVRKIRFWVEPGELKLVKVDMAKSHGNFDPNWKSADKPFPSARFSKIPSICAWYQEKTNDASVCFRSDFLEDLAAAEPPPFPEAEMRLLEERRELESYRRLLHEVYETDKPDVTEEIEAFSSSHAGLRVANQLAAMHNFLRGDCPRVHALWQEAQQVFESAPESTLYKALCAELKGQVDQSQALLNAAIAAQKNPPASLYFHAGRQVLEKNPNRAWVLANSCVRSYPFDLPCQELGAMAARLDGKFFKSQRFNIEDATFKILLKLEEFLPKHQYDQAFAAVAPLIQSYPQSIEGYLFLSWADSLAQVGTHSSYAERKMEAARILGGGTLDKIIEAVEKSGSPQLLIPVYRNKLRTQASDPNLWFRLIRAHAKAEQCDQVLSVIKEGTQYLPKYSSPLLQIQASCLVQKEKFKDALEVYLKILELKPKAWSTHYNLAAVYERLKMRKEAIAAYKETLDSSPPVDVKDAVQYRLLQLDK